MLGFPRSAKRLAEPSGAARPRAESRGPPHLSSPICCGRVPPALAALRTAAESLIDLLPRQRGDPSQRSVKGIKIDKCTNKQKQKNNKRYETRNQILQRGRSRHDECECFPAADPSSSVEEPRSQSVLQALEGLTALSCCAKFQ